MIHSQPACGTLYPILYHVQILLSLIVWRVALVLILYRLQDFVRWGERSMVDRVLVLEVEWQIFLATLLVGAIVWLGKRFGSIVRDWRHGSMVYKMLIDSAASTDHTFRSTEAIAKAVKLPEGRVEIICSQHPKIERNGAQKQSWRIKD